MVTGKAMEVIAGLRYTAEMYNVAWNIVVRNFAKPQMTVNAHLKRIYFSPPMQPYDRAALIKYARIVLICVNVLKQFIHAGELNSDLSVQTTFSSGQRHKKVNVGHENEVAHLCQTNEPVSTWTCLVQ